MKNVLFVFFFIGIPLFAQVIIKSGEEASIFALKNSQSYTLNKRYADISLKSAEWSIQGFLPTVDFSWNETDTAKAGGADSRNKSISVNISVPVFDGGKKVISYNMTKAERLYEVKMAEQEIDSFRSSVINQYYTCILQEKLLAIKQTLEANAKEQLAIIKKESEFGLALENDYLEYLISVRKIEDERKQAEREVRTQYRVFKVLLGLPGNADLQINNEEDFDFYSDFYLEPYAETLWKIVEKKNPTVKKNETALYYAEQQYKYNRRLFVPEISTSAGISFSGGGYPLNDPSYTAKVSISFSNIPFLPSSLQSSYGFQDKTLSSVNNSASVSASPNLNYFYVQNANSVSIKRQKIEFTDSVNTLYENVLKKIASYDDSLDSIKRLEETILLQKKRITISKQQVEMGRMKRIDYLDELIKESQQETNLIQLKVSLKSLKRELEILVCVPFGGLENVCK